MKKFMPGLLVLLILLLGCALKRNGSYTNNTFKTNNEKVIITGTAYNSQDNKMPFVIVESLDTGLSVITDYDGRYRLELEPGKHKLRAACIGFKLLPTKYLKLMKGDSVVVNFVLKESLDRTVN